MTRYDPQVHGARCDICPLRGKIVVPPSLNPSAKFIIVGEGPGRQEEKLLEPFVGLSGKLLDSTLRSVGLRRSDAELNNAALCRGESDKENAKAAECCAPRLLRELASLAGGDEPIVALGAAATRSILGVKSILTARGFVWRAREIPREKFKPGKTEKSRLKAESLKAASEIAGRHVFPMLHPAFVLRADTWGPLLRIDFERFARWLRDPAAFAFEDNAPYCLALDALRMLGPRVAVDIETDGIDILECKILSVQISDGARTVVLHPWRVRYARPLSKFLRSRAEVVTHNGFLFDIPILARHGVK